MDISVVIPVLNESQSLGELSDRLHAAFAAWDSKADYEIIFVDDGSTDNSRAVITDLCLKNTNIRCVFLRQNFGKSSALNAGFQHAAGELIITMDGDLEDRPEEMHKLITRLNEGFDCVSGWKQYRADGQVRRIGSFVFNLLASRSFGLRLHDINCGFKIYRQKVVKDLVIYGQYHRFIPVLVQNMGYKVSEIQINTGRRKFGGSRFPSFRFKAFFDLISLLFIFRFQFTPLYFFGTLSLCFILPSAAVLGNAVVMLTLWYLNLLEKPVITFDRPLLALSTVALLTGVNILLAGLVCDFILHHQRKQTVQERLTTIIAEII